MHAIINAHFHRAQFDEPRVSGGMRPDLFIGPPRSLGGPLFEEMVPPRGVRIFHVMQARPKHLRLMEEEL